MSDPQQRSSKEDDMGKEIDLEKLKEQEGDLTDAQFEAIRDAAHKDSEKPEKEEGNADPETPEETGEPKEEGEPSVEIEGEEKSEEDLLNTPEEELNDDEKSKRQEILDKRAEEEQKLIETPDEKLDDAGIKRKQELIKENEQSEAEKLETSAKEYSEKNKISLEDAKKELKQIDEIKSRYKGDPDQIAKSNLYLQRMASKAKNELKEVQEASKVKKVSPEEIRNSIDENRFIVNGRAITRDMVIKYARNNKDFSDFIDNMDDEAVYNFALKDLAKKQHESLKVKEGKVKEKAATKRVEAINELANYDNKFFEQAKGIIENISDQYIANDKFNINHILSQVKGDRYDDDIKSAYERGRKEGEQQAKIIEKKPPVGEGKNKKPEKTGLKVKLTPDQKSRALNMFESAEVPDEKKFEMYVNVHPEEFGIKKKKKGE